MRQTIREIQVNNAYRWYLGYSLYEKISHFSIYGKNYTRGIKDTGLADKIFNKVLELAINSGFIHPEQVFIDATHIKASANKRKYSKEIVEATAKYYQDELDEEISADRKSHGKKPLQAKESVKKTNSSQHN